MKFGQFIGCNMRNIILEKSYTKCPRPSLKKSKLSISQDQQSEVLYNLFIMYAQVEDHQNILKLRVTTSFYLTSSVFKKQKDV